VNEGLGGLLHRVRPAAGVPQGALVLLHGRGADENDLFAVLDFFDPERRLAGVTVRAPLALPPGGWHWYGVREIGFPDPPTFLSTFALLDAFLDDLPAALGVPWARTVLGGFSQGTVMSYAMSLARSRPSPAGILAMSGFIPTVSGFELDLASRAQLPVAIVHGTLDPVIDVDFGRQARIRLEQEGLAVTYRESPVGHTIDPGIGAVLQQWLLRTLPAPDGHAVA
jgi:phospholipase/carboxylesterase